ncbi:MAG: Crp/Fnr family transcriptional regulator [Inhella sp.]
MALVETLARDAWFARCSPALQQLLVAHGHELALGAGQLLFRRGDAEADLCCVLEGALRVGSLRADGREALLARVEPVQWFGEIALIDGQARTHDAVAEGAARVWRVPAARLVPALDAQPQLWREVAQLACAKLRLMFEALEDIALLPLAARLAKRLLLQAQAYGSRSAQPRLRLAQEHLALMLGVSRQSVNKALGELEAQGLLRRHYGEIELLDVAALQRLAQE